MNEERFWVASAAAALILAWFYLARRPAPAALPGETVLSYRLSLRVFAWLTALAIPSLLIAIMVSGRSFLNPLLLGGVMLGLGFLGGLLLLETERTRFMVSTTGLRSFSPWRGPREIRWREVDKVTFSGPNRWFVLTAGAMKIRVSCLLAGVKTFAAKVQEHVAAERRVEAERGFATLR